MALKCGIVGLPNVGKSTLFNALTSGKALAANYPFATKDPNVGIITVPDERLDKLAELVQPHKVQPTTVEIVDIAGLIKGASKGEGLGNQFLGNIREVDAIVHVVRCFEDGNVVHVDGDVNPIRDKEVIDMELQFKDIEVLEKRVLKLKKQAKALDKTILKQLDFAERLLAFMEDGKSARAFEVEEQEQEILDEFLLLTAKPILYVCNVGMDDVQEGNEHTKVFKEAVKDEQAEVILVSASIEADIAELETKEERLEFLAEMDLTEPGVNRVTRSCYKLLNLITYFTAGVQEVRAWTILDGTLAPGAAGVIHTDFERGFIKADVIKYNDFVEYGSEQKVKEVGKMSMQGKEYLVEDGDIMHFKFNV